MHLPSFTVLVREVMFRRKVDRCSIISIISIGFAPMNRWSCPWFPLGFPPWSDDFSMFSRDSPIFPVPPSASPISPRHPKDTKGMKATQKKFLGTACWSCAAALVAAKPVVWPNRMPQASVFILITSAPTHGLWALRWPWGSRYIGSCSIWLYQSL